MKNIMRMPKALMQFVVEVASHFNQTNCAQRAASLAYASLLSLVPLMTVTFAALSVFPAFQHVSGRIQNFIFKNFVATAGDVVQGYLTSFMDKAGQLSAIGLVILIITAIFMMITMEQTFDVIWQAPRQRRWVSALMLYWTILTLSPLLMGLGFLAASSFYTSVSAHYQVIAAFTHIVGPFSLSVVVFSLLYSAVPHSHVPLKNAFVAAFIAGLLFEFAKHLFTFYIQHFGNYKILYGALAAIPVFLLWIYVCWLITLLGAVVSFCLTHPRLAKVH